MPLGEAIAEFIAEVFAHGMMEGLLTLVRSLGALVRSLFLTNLSYRAALKTGGNARVGALVLVLFGLLVALTTG